MSAFPKADAYGVALVSAGGKILLREPTGHFGGYAWTFAKGLAAKGETPEETARRQALEETGYRVELLEAIQEVFPGTTSTTALFLAGPLGRQGPTDKETSATRWVSFAEAAKLIAQTTSATGRKRDLAILAAAEKALKALDRSKRPAVCKEDWRALPLPQERARLKLDLFYDAAAMERIRKGFLPKEMEQKWFVWFEEPMLRLHRSWTGFCIYEVEFVREKTGWRAVSALVNRNPQEAMQIEAEDEDQSLIKTLIDGLIPSGDQKPSPSSFALALQQASQPNYLGSPQVVSGVIRQVIDAAISHFKGETNFNAVWDLIWSLGQDIAGGQEYTLMPGWHTPQALGASLVKLFGVKPEEIFAEDLDYFLTEAMMLLFLKTRDLLRGFSADSSTDWEQDALPQLKALHDWAVNAFLGVAESVSPGVVLAHFEWRQVDGVFVDRDDDDDETP